MLLKILIVFFSIVAFKSISNFTKYKRCKKLATLHLKWLNNECHEFPQYKGEILSLFKGANIPDTKLPVSQPTGYGQIATFNASVYTNFPSKVASFAADIADKFDESIGTYRRRFYESFNLLYWLEIVIFFPKHLLEYLNFNTEKPAFKLCNILFTFIWWFIGVLVIFFAPQLKQIIFSLLGQP